MNLASTCYLPIGPIEFGGLMPGSSRLAGGDPSSVRHQIYARPGGVLGSRRRRGHHMTAPPPF